MISPSDHVMRRAPGPCAGGVETSLVLGMHPGASYARSDADQPLPQSRPARPRAVRAGQRSGERRDRTGVVLLEVLVAVALLAIGCLTVVTLVAETSQVVARARARDRALREASAFLEAVALWPREDLDRHLGDRPEGAWVLTVARPTPVLYTVTLADSGAATGSRSALLRTILFRPEVAHALAP